MDTGEIAALAAALLWTISSMLWGQIRISAFVLNACKNVIGCLFIFGHLVAIGFYTGSFSCTTSPVAWGWLTLSGLVGIVIGDTCYFRSLQILGPRRALLIGCASPLFATFLQFQFLDQPLAGTIVLGILLTVFGVGMVISDRRADSESPGLLPGTFRAGIALGFLSAVCQAVGGLFSELGMRDNCSAIEATMIRLIVAGMATVLVLVIQKGTRSSLGKAFLPQYLKWIIPATAVGTWLGIWCSQLAYKNADLAIAQTLMSTCPLFAIPLVWFFFGHKATRIAIVGTIIAIFGVWLTVQKDEPQSSTSETRVTHLVVRRFDHGWTPMHTDKIQAEKNQVRKNRRAATIQKTKPHTTSVVQNSSQNHGAAKKPATKLTDT